MSRRRKPTNPRPQCRKLSEGEVVRAIESQRGRRLSHAEKTAIIAMHRASPVVVCRR